MFVPCVSAAVSVSVSVVLFISVCCGFVREYEMQCSTEDFCVGKPSMESIIVNLEDDV